MTATMKEVIVDDGSADTTARIAVALADHWLARAAEIQASIAYQRDVLHREPSETDVALLEWIRARFA